MKKYTPALSQIYVALCGCRRILIATDFDGTLCPIADTPSEARLTERTFGLLRRAVRCPRLTAAVISGRALIDLRGLLPSDLILAGNHGMETEGRGLRFIHEGAKECGPVLLSACEGLEETVRAWPGAWVEQKGLTATLHFRRVERRGHVLLVRSARNSLRAFRSEIALRSGKCALEIRPRVKWDKGSALQYIQERAGPFDACICLGDDGTDEPMFRASGGLLSIRVGDSRFTKARYTLPDPAAVAVLLTIILDICGSDTRSQRVTGFTESRHAAAV